MQGVVAVLHECIGVEVAAPDDVGDDRCCTCRVFPMVNHPSVQTMTTRSDELRTVAQVREFLRELVDAKTTPKVPATIRDKARRLLRHYPYTSSIITKESHT